MIQRAKFAFSWFVLYHIPIVENILTGQYSCPLRVVALNIAEGWVQDVTVDIAWAVLNLARRENRSIRKSAQEFLERVLGADAPVAD